MNLSTQNAEEFESVKDSNEYSGYIDVEISRLSEQ